MFDYPNKARTFEEMGDYFKAIEKNFTLSKFSPNLPIVARLDGRHFHTFTKGLEKPFSTMLLRCMTQTCIAIGEEFNPFVIYTQSDEITVVFLPNHDMFSNTVQKYISNLSAYASVIFNNQVQENIPSKKSLNPTFDCRVFQLSSMQEVYENILWRQIDAMKNSVSLLASSYFSVKELANKNTSDRKKMLLEKNVDWYSYNIQIPHFTRGAFFKKVYKEKQLDKKYENNENIIERDGLFFVNRKVWEEVNIPRLSSVVNGSEDDKQLIWKVFNQVVF